MVYYLIFSICLVWWICPFRVFELLVLDVFGVLGWFWLFWCPNLCVGFDIRHNLGVVGNLVRLFTLW